LLTYEILGKISRILCKLGPVISKEYSAISIAADVNMGKASTYVSMCGVNLRQAMLVMSHIHGCMGDFYEMPFIIM